MKLEFSRQISEEYSSSKFYDNPSSGSRVLCGQANRQAEKKTNLIVTFHNFVTAPKKACPQRLHKLGPTCQNNCLSPNWNDQIWTVFSSCVILCSIFWPMATVPKRRQWLTSSLESLKKLSCLLQSNLMEWLMKGDGILPTECHDFSNIQNKNVVRSCKAISDCQISADHRERAVYNMYQAWTARTLI